MTAPSTPIKLTKNTPKTTSRRRSAGVASAKRRHAPIQLEIDDDVSSSSAGENNDDLFEDVTERSRKKASSIKNLMVVYEKSELIEAHDTLIKISLEKTSVKPLAKEWSELFSYDKHTALYDLLGLFTALTGSSRVLKTEFIESGFEFDTLLKEIEQSVLIRTKNDNKPILPNKQIIFKASKYLGNIIRIGKENILKDELALDVIINFVCSFSKSKYRAIRSMFTSVAIQIITSLCELQRDISKEQELTNSQLTQLNNEDHRKNKSKINKLSDKIQKFSLNKLDIEKIMSTIFNDMFTMRYRDIDSQIRAMCIKALKNWILLLPDMFQKIHNLKYFLWALSDKTNIVRRECVISVSFIISKDELHNAIMEQFIDKLKTRIMEMASKDIDQSVNLTAIQLIENIYTKGKGSKEEMLKIFQIMTHKNIRLRAAVGNIFLKYFDVELLSKNDRFQTLKLLLNTILRLLENHTNQNNSEILDEYCNDVELNDHFINTNKKLYLIYETLYNCNLEQIKDYSLFIECLTDKQNNKASSKKFTQNERELMAKMLVFCLELNLGNIEKNTDPNSILCSLQDTLITNDKILLMLDNSLNKNEKITILNTVSSILSCEAFMRLKKEQTLMKLLNEIKTIYNKSSDIFELIQCFKSFKVLLVYDEAEIVLPNEVLKFKHNLVSELKQNITNKKHDKIFFVKCFCSLVVYNSLLAPSIIDIDAKTKSKLFDKLIVICMENYKQNNEMFYLVFQILCRGLFYTMELNKNKIGNEIDQTNSPLYIQELDSLKSYMDSIVDIAFKFINQSFKFPKDLKKLNINNLHVRKTVFVSLCDIFTLSQLMFNNSHSENIKYIETIDKQIDQYSSLYDRINPENNYEEFKICLDAFVTYIKLVVQNSIPLSKFSILALKYVGKIKAKNEKSNSINILDKCIEHFFNVNLVQRLIEIFKNVDSNTSLLETMIENIFEFAVEKFDIWYTTNDNINNVELLLKCNNLSQLISRCIELSLSSNNIQDNTNVIQETSKIVCDCHLKIIQKVLPTINEFIQDSSNSDKDPFKIFYVLQCLLNKKFVTPSHAKKLIDNIELEFNEALISPHRDSNVFFTFYSYFDLLFSFTNQ